MGIMDCYYISNIITIINLKGNWINTHNITVVTQDSAITKSSQNLTIIRSVEKGEESRYLLGLCGTWT
jgi:hypothetical protein